MDAKQQLEAAARSIAHTIGLPPIYLAVEPIHGEWDLLDGDAFRVKPWDVEIVRNDRDPKTKAMRNGWDAVIWKTIHGGRDAPDDVSDVTLTWSPFPGRALAIAVRDILAEQLNDLIWSLESDPAPFRVTMEARNEHGD
jgi:hypothetical protein